MPGEKIWRLLGNTSSLPLEALGLKDTSWTIKTAVQEAAHVHPARSSPDARIKVALGRYPEYQFVLPDGEEWRARIDESTPVFKAIDELRHQDGAHVISGPFFLVIEGHDILRVPEKERLPLSENSGAITISRVSPVDFQFTHPTFTGDVLYNITLPLDATCTMPSQRLSEKHLFGHVAFSIFDKGKVSPVELRVSASRQYSTTVKSAWTGRDHPTPIELADGDMTPLSDLLERSRERWPSEGDFVIQERVSSANKTIQTALDAIPSANPIVVHLEIPLPKFEFFVDGEEVFERIHPRKPLRNIMSSHFGRTACLIDNRFRLAGPIGACFGNRIDLVGDEAMTRDFSPDGAKRGVCFRHQAPRRTDLERRLLDDKSIPMLAGVDKVEMGYDEMRRGAAGPDCVLEGFPYRAIQKPLKLTIAVTRKYAIRGRRSVQEFAAVSQSLEDSSTDFARIRCRGTGVDGQGWRGCDCRRQSGGKNPGVLGSCSRDSSHRIRDPRRSFGIGTAFLGD
jgi:hypothetical protein